MLYLKFLKIASEFIGTEVLSPLTPVLSPLKKQWNQNCQIWALLTLSSMMKMDHGASFLVFPQEVSRIITLYFTFASIGFILFFCLLANIAALGIDIININEANIGPN